MQGLVENDADCPQLMLAWLDIWRCRAVHLKNHSLTPAAILHQSSYRPAMIKAAIPALLIAIMAVGPASAGFYNGNELLSACKGESQIFAMGYFMGVADMMAIYAPDHICIPAEATGEQVNDLVCQYIESHPDMRHHNGSYLAYVALLKAFPCKQ